MEKIIVTGATGQDGSYMIEYLLENTDNYIIAGIRRTSQAILSNLEKVLNHPRFKMITLDLSDGESIRDLIKTEKPDYFINFGASTFVADSWKNPNLCMQVNANSLIHILESIREYCPNCVVYQAGTSEMFGDVKYVPQDENHPFSPRSMYGVSKCAAEHICKVYRESYGLKIYTCILFNHESTRRQEYFVTRKITKEVAKIYNNFKNGEDIVPLELGNLDAKRDWSHAKDFVRGVWDIVTKGKDYKYVLASGETHSVREFVELAFKYSKLDNLLVDNDYFYPKFKWVGDGINERYVLEYHENGTPKEVDLVKINPKFYRPAEVDLLHGDSSKARLELGWSPNYTFEDLVKDMVEHDLGLTYSKKSDSFFS